MLDGSCEVAASLEMSAMSSEGWMREGKVKSREGSTHLPLMYTAWLDGRGGGGWGWMLPREPRSPLLQSGKQSGAWLAARDPSSANPCSWRCDSEFTFHCRRALFSVQSSRSRKTADEHMVLRLWPPSTPPHLLVSGECRIVECCLQSGMTFGHVVGTDSMNAATPAAGRARHVVAV